MSPADQRRNAVQGQMVAPAGGVTPDTTVRIPQHVVHRTFVSETVVLNLATGKYHGLNPTGGRMLEVLERTPRIEDAAAVIAEEFQVSPEQVRSDLLTFCNNLAELGLIEISAGGVG